MSCTKVTLLQRHLVVGNHSVERIFDDVRDHMPSDIDMSTRINTYPSQGALPRLKDALAVRTLSADVFHITGDVHYMAWFAPEDRTLLTILDCVSLERMSGLKYRVMKALWYDLPIRRATRLTTISTFSAQSIEKFTGYPARRIAIVPPPLSSEFQRSDKPFDTDRPRILQIGTTQNKNIERVAHALAGLPVTLSIVWVLTDEQKSVLDRHGTAYENHVGLSRDDLLEQYRACDIVMFASLYEGFGMPVVEGQATGRPVITSDRCSMPEAAGDGALFVDPEDPDAIRAAVMRLLDDASLRDDLVARGLENAKRYAPQVIAGQYAELYREMAS